MRKAILFTALIFLLATASAFPLSLENIDRSAEINDTARFQVQIQNNLSQDHSFKISSIEAPPKTLSWFNYGSSEEVSPGENATINLEIDPSDSSVQGSYGFKLNVRTEKGDNLKSVEGYFTVDRDKSIIITSYNVENSSIRPGQSAKASINIINTDSASVEDIRFVSGFEGLKVEKKGFELPSGAELSQSFSIDTPINISPGEKNFETRVFNSGQLSGNVSQGFRVERVENLTIDRIKDDGVISNKLAIVAYNSGNSEDTAVFNASVPSYLESLTSLNRSADRIQRADGETTYYWNLNLEPGESKSVGYSVSYWPPITVLVFLIGGIVGIKRLQSTLSIDKKVIDAEDGIKIRLSLKNTSSGSIDKIELEDFVPDIASVDEEFEMVKPYVRKTGNGTKLNWQLEDISQGEERIIEYKIKPVYEVEGGVRLPAAKAVIGEEEIAETDEVETAFEP